MPQSNRNLDRPTCCKYISPSHCFNGRLISRFLACCRSIFGSAGRLGSQILNPGLAVGESCVSSNRKSDTTRHDPATPSVRLDPGSRATPLSGFVKAEIIACPIPPHGCWKDEHPTFQTLEPIFWAHKLPSSTSFAIKCQTHRKAHHPVRSAIVNQPTVERVVACTT